MTQISDSNSSKKRATYEADSVEYNDGTGEVSTIGCGTIGTCPSI